jgi:small subunit ribosomal protein S14
MARKALRVKAALRPKFKSRKVNRCHLCGRSHAFIRKFNMCRLCFRKRALNGELPGITKASW